jgi:hypothetical protein|nr:hypothetical protein [Kofleriaceae bacterium]
MDTVFALGLVAGMVAVVMLLHAQTRDAHMRALAALGDGLTNPQLHREHSAVTGLRGGIAIRHELTTHGAGSDSEPFTHVEVATGGAPLSLHVVPHRSGDAGHIARGEMIDISVGDAAFDDMYRVEGGPEDVVTKLLSPRLIETMVAGRRCELETVSGIEGPRLRLAIQGWVDTASTAQELWDIMIDARMRLERAHAALDAEVPLAMTGSPYRPEPDDAPLREARAARAAEASRVEDLCQQRVARQAEVTWVVLAIMVGGMLAAALMASH